MRATVVASSAIAAFCVLSAVAVVEILFEGSRLPGSKFVFEDGFEGVYCLVISPEHSAAPVDAEGFALYTFNSQGIAHSSTFPVGKGAINRTVVVDRRLKTTQLIEDRTPCGSLTFEDRAVLLGVVGSSSCPMYNAARPPSFSEALAIYCK